MFIQFNETQILLGRYLLICGQSFYLRDKNSCSNVRYILQQFNSYFFKLYSVRVNHDGSFGEREVISFSDFLSRGFV